MGWHGEQNLSSYMVLSWSDWGLSQTVGHTKLDILKPCDYWAPNFRPPHVSGESQWLSPLVRSQSKAHQESVRRLQRGQALEEKAGDQSTAVVVHYTFGHQAWLVGKSPKLNGHFNGIKPSHKVVGGLLLCLITKGQRWGHELWREKLQPEHQIEAWSPSN